MNQILAKQLHNTDGEVLEYTTKLMDKLEQVDAPCFGGEASLGFLMLHF